MAGMNQMNFTNYIEVFFNSLDEFYKLGSRKRVEENNKFIYKFTIKKLKLKIYNEYALEPSMKSEEFFYSYYFGEQAQKLDLKLEEFKDPLLVHESNKTLNKIFLKKIFQSSRFKRDFMSCLET